MMYLWCFFVLCLCCLCSGGNSQVVEAKKSRALFVITNTSFVNQRQQDSRRDDDDDENNNNNHINHYDLERISNNTSNYYTTVRTKMRRRITATRTIATQRKLAEVATVIPEEDTMTTLNWDSINCKKVYPFATAGNFIKCAILEFCKTKAGTYGYRQKNSTATTSVDDSTCLSPGPIIRVKPGIKYLLTLQNSIDGVTTNIHVHGIHLSGSGNADNPLRNTVGSSSKTSSSSSSSSCIHYVWDIPSNHMGGTHWYHPHHVPNVFEQMNKGGYGMFIVEDKYTKLLPRSIRSDNDKRNIQQFLSNEKILMANRKYASSSPFSSTSVWYGNGNRKGTKINIVQNEWTRIRVGIVSPKGESIVLTVQDTIKKLSTTKICPDAYVIAYDGIYVRTIPGSPLPRRVSASGRIDIALRCTGAIGTTAVLMAGSSSTIGRITIVSSSSSSSSLSSTTTALSTNTTGSVTSSKSFPTPYTSSGTKQWIPLRPSYVRDLSTTGINQHLDVVLDDILTINGGIYYNDDSSNIIDTYSIGQVIEWNISGTEHHPLHLHVHHMQLVSKCGSMEIGEFYDTIQSSGLDSDTNNNDIDDTCTVRFVLQDYDGITLLHCHNNMHSDFHMAATVNVTIGTNTKTTIQSTNPDFDDYKCY